MTKSPPYTRPQTILSFGARLFSLSIGGKAGDDVLVILWSIRLVLIDAGLGCFAYGKASEDGTFLLHQTLQFRFVIWIRHIESVVARRVRSREM